MYGEKPTESPAGAVNGMELSRILKAHPELNLMVQNLKTGVIYKLVLNMEGELCYLDGKSKWTISAREECKYALLEESLKQIESLAQGEPQPEDVKISVDRTIAHSRLDTYTLIRGLNNFIESVATFGKVEIGLPEGLYGNLCTPIATVDFHLIAPAFIEIKPLARQYFLLIRQRLQQLEDQLNKQGIFADKILTKGLVKNVPGLRSELENRLRSARIHYAIIEGNDAFFRLEAWKENPYPV